MGLSAKSIGFGLMLAISCAAHSQYVIEDQGVGITAEELEYIVGNWTPEMRRAAANDLGDRFELLNLMLANKRIAQEADKYSPEENAELYWRNRLIIRNANRQFVVNEYMERLEIPDMTALARERYNVHSAELALVPEERKSSHILLRCTPPDCDPEKRRQEAQSILDRLSEGESFESLAAEFSEDPGSKNQGGKFDRWLQRGMKGVDPYYSQAVFELDEVGQHSGLVDSTFGIHIIRLDEVKPASRLPFEEVKDKIIADLELTYRQLAAREFDARYRLTDDAYINGDEMDRIFQEYKEESMDVGQ